jgi:hypothetical protein
MIWDVEFIVALPDNTWLSRVEKIPDSDIDESEGIEQGFINWLVYHRPDSMDALAPSYIGVLYFSQDEESPSSVLEEEE